MKNRAFLLLFFGLILGFMPFPAAAQEAQPGDACAVAGAWVRSGGPEITGGHLLVCDGANWISILDYADSGRSLLQVDYDGGTCTAIKQGRLRYVSAGDQWDYCDGTSWMSLTVGVINDLTDVNTPTPVDGEVLTFDNASGKWIAAAGGSGGGAINDLSDAITYTSSVFLGSGAGVSDNATNVNTAIGINALNANTGGSANTASGYLALTANTTGGDNTAIGSLALTINTLGSNNTAVGSDALPANTMGADNIAIGNRALLKNTTGIQNTAVGTRALRNNTTGNDNTAVGYRAGKSNGGIGNVFVGSEAGSGNGVGANNTFVGWLAGSLNTTGSNNIAIGNAVDAPTITTSNYLNIGNAIFGDMGNTTSKVDSGANITFDGAITVTGCTGCGGGGSSLWTAGTGDIIYYNIGSPRVGIGTATPSSVFEVKGPNARITLNDSVGTRFGINSLSNVFTINEIGIAERFRIADNGNVGIGTTNPLRTLEVNNTMRFTNSSADTNDGVLGVATFGVPGLNIVGINTDATYRKYSLWGEITQQQNDGTNTLIGATHFTGNVQIDGTCTGCGGFDNLGAGGTTTGSLFSTNGTATVGRDSTDFIRFDNNSQAFWKINGSWEYQINPTHFSPFVNITNDLGTSAQRWRDIWTDDIMTTRVCNNAGGSCKNQAALLTSETDPKVLAVTTNQWCRGTGSAVTCDQPPPSGGGPVNCTTIGQHCSDGTVFAGDTNMYTTPCDAGRVWVSSCTGTSLQITGWATANTVTGATSTTDGGGNTAILSALNDAAGAPYNPALYCSSLTVGGHTDWYLPAQNEFTTLSTNSAAIGDFLGPWYFSSTEVSSTKVNVVNIFAIPAAFNKLNSTYRIRCVRRN